MNDALTEKIQGMFYEAIITMIVYLIAACSGILGGIIYWSGTTASYLLLIVSLILLSAAIGRGSDAQKLRAILKNTRGG